MIASECAPYPPISLVTNKTVVGNIAVNSVLVSDLALAADEVTEGVVRAGASRSPTISGVEVEV